MERANLALQREIEERERIQNALLQASQRLSGILQHAHEIIYTLTATGLFVFVSPAATKVLGYQQEEIVGSDFRSFVHPEDQQVCKEFLQNVLAGADNVERIIFRAQHKNGGWRWLASTGGRLPDQEDENAAFVGIAQDITEEQRALDMLAASEQKYRLLTELSADVIFTTDLSSTFTYISPAVERLTGYTPEEAMQGSLFDLLHEKSREIILQAQQERLEAERNGRRENMAKAWELQLQRKDGSLVWTETMTTPLRDAEGAFSGILGVTRDISGRKRSEQQLKQAHRDMGALISAITAILVLVDDNNRISHWNESARQALGLTQRQARGLKLDLLSLPWEHDAVLHGLEACRESGETQRLDDLRYLRSDQSEGLLGLTCYPVEGGGVLLLGRDVTKARSRELRQAHEQKMQSIGRLAAGVAHEINTPVQYLGFNMGFLQDAFTDLNNFLQKSQALQRLLADSLAPPSPEANDTAAAFAASFRPLLENLQAEAQRIDLEYLLQETPLALDNSRKGVEQISSIVQAMKQLSHPGRMAERDMGLVDVNAITRNAATVTRNEWKNHSELELDLEEALPLVPAWGGELGQVLVNLLLNAAQAAEETAASQPRGVGAILVQTKSCEDCVSIQVSDSGPGIPEERRNKIFDPFYTTKGVGKGSGQGLAIAHAIIVEQHGGSIDVDESEFGGARFTIRLSVT